MNLCSDSSGGHSGIIPGSFQDHSGVSPGSFWDHSRITPASFRAIPGIAVWIQRRLGKAIRSGPGGGGGSRAKSVLTSEIGLQDWERGSKPFNISPSRNRYVSLPSTMLSQVKYKRKSDANSKHHSWV